MVRRNAKFNDRSQILAWRVSSCPLKKLSEETEGKQLLADAGEVLRSTSRHELLTYYK